MITIHDLQQMIDQAIHSGQVTLDSEVRYINRDRQDCSFEAQWVGIGPGHTSSGTPVDRRFGSGAMLLAQESKLRDAPAQLLLELDW